MSKEFVKETRCEPCIKGGGGEVWGGSGGEGGGANGSFRDRQGNFTFKSPDPEGTATIGNFH